MNDLTTVDGFELLVGDKDGVLLGLVDGLELLVGDKDGALLGLVEGLLDTDGRGVPTGRLPSPFPFPFPL